MAESFSDNPFADLAPVPEDDNPFASLAPVPESEIANPFSDMAPVRDDSYVEEEEGLPKVEDPGLLDQLVAGGHELAGRFDIEEAVSSGEMINARARGEETTLDNEWVRSAIRFTGIAVGEKPSDEQLRDRLQGLLDSAAEHAAKAETVEFSAATQKFLDENSENSIIEDFWDSPISIIAELGARSGANMVPGAVAAGIGSLLAGPVGFAVGQGLGEGRVEYAASMMEGISEALDGDMRSADKLLALLNDKEKMGEIQEKAMTRARMIGGVTALTAGIATKTLGFGLKGRIKSEMANVVAQMGIQSVGGGAGEALAQHQTGEEFKPREIAAEAVGELVGAPVEVAQASYAGVRETRADQAKAKADFIRKEMEQIESQTDVMEADIREKAAQEGRDDLSTLVDVQAQLGAYDLRMADLRAELDVAEEEELQQQEFEQAMADEMDAELAKVEEAQETTKLREKVAEGFEEREEENRTALAEELINSQDREDAEARIGERTSRELIEQDLERVQGPDPINPAMVEAMLKAGRTPSEVMETIRVAREEREGVQQEERTEPLGPESQLTDESPDYVVSEEGEVRTPGQVIPERGEGRPGQMRLREAREPETTGPVAAAPSAAERAKKLELIDSRAHEAATSTENALPEPTAAQKAAGNYKKGHISLLGLDISIENPQGSLRTGTREDGSKWSQKMANHYGYIRGTESAEGVTEQLDVFIGDKFTEEAGGGTVFVVDQVRQDSGQFDEHKALIGFATEQEAVAAYKDNYEEGWTVGKVTAMPVEEFKTWALEKGNKTQPLHPDTPVGGALEADAASRRPQRKRRLPGRKDKGLKYSLPGGYQVVRTEETGARGTEIQLSVKTAEGEPAGIVDLMVLNDSIQILLSAVPKRQQGKGLGMAMYNDALKIAKERGLNLISDRTVSEDAIHMYEALERRGAKVTRNPNAEEKTRTKDDGTEETYLSVPLGQSVFQVEPTNLRLSLKDLTEGPGITEDLTEENIRSGLKGLLDYLGDNLDLEILEKPPEGVSQDARGSYDLNTGKVQIYLNNLTDLEDAAKVIIHEGVTHKGLRFMLSADVLNNTMLEIYNANQERMIEFTEVLRKAGYPNRELAPASVAEEYVAHLSEQGDPDGVLKRVYAQLRKVLRSMGIVKDWTDGDLRQLIRESAAALRRGKPLSETTIKMEVEVDGENFTVTGNAATLLRQHDKRVSVIKKLRGCIK